MKTDLCRRDGSQGALGIVLKSAVQRYWFKSTMYVRLTLCFRATQGLDVSMSDDDVIDIEALKKKGHREVAAGQVNFPCPIPLRLHIS